MQMQRTDGQLFSSKNLTLGIKNLWNLEIILRSILCILLMSNTRIHITIYKLRDNALKRNRESTEFFTTRNLISVVKLKPTLFA